MRCQYRGVTQSQYNLQVVSNEVTRNFKFIFIINTKSKDSQLQRKARVLKGLGNKIISNCFISMP